MSKFHELKILPEYYVKIWTGKKKFELRKDDRFYQIGDYLKLKVWQNNQYTGEEITCRIIDILKGFEGLKEGYVILSIIVISSINTKYQLQP
jgi:ParB family transcriptional regulator, chromosome partitioning protein